MADALKEQAQERLAWEIASKHYPSTSRFAYRRACRKELKNAVGLDPATIFLLLQVLIQIWKWAKDNGYFAVPAARPANAPSFSASAEAALLLIDEPDDE